MKGLLQSKRLRKNLYNWIFMYIGAILLFTSVVTYSRYMSKLILSDDSRTAKFDVKIEPKDCDYIQNGSSYYCDDEIIKNPTDELKYYFTLDATFEVKTDLFLTIKVDERFTLYCIREFGTSDCISISSASSFPVNIENSSDGIGRILKTYEVTVTNFNPNNCKEDCAKEDGYYKVVTVGYSAEQVAVNYSGADK